MDMNSWEDLARFLAGLPDEDRARFSRYAGLELSGDENTVVRALRSYASENPSATPSGLLATTGSQAGFASETGFARGLGSAALEFAVTDEERQLAHVSLAQTHFQNRRDEDELRRFEEHCRAAVELGHAGTFCYQRLAALYEYRGDPEEAIRICRLAVEALDAAGDHRSAGKFEKRLDRLSKK